MKSIKLSVLALLMYLQVIEIWHVLTLSFITGRAQSFGIGGPGETARRHFVVDDRTTVLSIGIVRSRHPVHSVWPGGSKN